MTFFYFVYQWLVFFTWLLELQSQIWAKMLYWKQDFSVFTGHTWRMNKSGWDSVSLLEVYDHHKMFSMRSWYPIHTTILSKSQLPAPNIFFFSYNSWCISRDGESLFLLPHYPSLTLPVVPHLYDTQALLSGEKPLNRKQVAGQLCAQPPTYTVGGRVDRSGGSCVFVQICGLILYFCKQTFSSSSMCVCEWLL